MESKDILQNTSDKKSNKNKSNKLNLWQFILSILQDPLTCPCCIYWVDIQQGIFKIADSKFLSKLWGISINKPKMNYQMLSRSLRYSYDLKIIRKVPNCHLTYQFCKLPSSIVVVQHFFKDEKAKNSQATKDHSSIIYYTNRDPKMTLPSVKPLSKFLPRVASLIINQQKRNKHIKPKQVHVTFDGVVTGLHLGNQFDQDKQMISSDFNHNPTYMLVPANSSLSLIQSNEQVAFEPDEKELISSEKCGIQKHKKEGSSDCLETSPFEYLNITKCEKKIKIIVIGSSSEDDNMIS